MAYSRYALSANASMGICSIPSGVKVVGWVMIFSSRFFSSFAEEAAYRF